MEPFDRTPNPTHAQVIVIGGGISGLVCAYRLQEIGISVLLLEKEHRLGGMIASDQREGFLFELGPQSFSFNETLLALVEKVGLGSELVQADPRASRYIFARGRLWRAPMSPPALLVSSVLSVGAKARLLSELFRKSQPPKEDESVADFVRRKFNAELLDVLVGPFVSGIYAADAENLSLRSAFPSVYRWEKDFGSVLRGAMKSRPPKGKPPTTFFSFKAGGETLTRALGESLGDLVWRGTAVRSIRRITSSGVPQYEVQAERGGRSESFLATAIVVSTDTRSAAEMLAGISHQFTAPLTAIEYAPVIIAGTGYDRRQVGNALDGYGFLVSRKEERSILGTVFNSSLFPGRAPEGKVLLTTFVGGATNPGLLNLSDEEIASVVSAELSGILQITGPSVARVICRLPRAIPQYKVGHGRIITALRQLMAGLPGLFLTGNYLQGPAIGTCVEQALRRAQDVRKYLASVDQRFETKQIPRPTV